MPGMLNNDNTYDTNSLFWLKHMLYLFPPCPTLKVATCSSRQQVKELKVLYITHFHTQPWKQWWNKVPQTQFKPEILSYSYLVLPALWNFYHVSHNFKTNYHNTNASGIFGVGGTPLGSRNSQRIPNDLYLHTSLPTDL